MKITNYTDAPEDVNEALEHAIILEDFLPSPEEFIRRAKK
jgi:hypothetical protein